MQGKNCVADFILYALIAGISLAIVTGPLGSFIVWRRMSYFGDTLAHAALLGIALGLLIEVNIQLSIVLVCLLSAVMLIALEKKKTLALDALLGILAHSSLALGVVVLALSNAVQVNLEAYLFGELLTISRGDLLWITACCFGVLVVLLAYWNSFLSITVHEELAEIDGINVNFFKYLLIVLLAVITAVAMKIVGVLLITSLLIIPPAAARQIANTPEKMAVRASIIGCLSVLGGFYFAFVTDTPVGPTIVVMATVFFVLLYLLPARRRIS
jgi:zinc transport system permease protein